MDVAWRFAVPEIAINPLATKEFPSPQSDAFDGDATRPGRKKEKDEDSKSSVFDFSQVLEPNQLVDTMLNLTLIIFDQIENHTPLKSFELPIVERYVTIPYMGLNLPLGTAIRMTEGSVYGLQTVARRGEAKLKKDGKTLIFAAPLVLKFTQYNYTLDLQTLFLNFREKVTANVYDVLVDVEARITFEPPDSRKVTVTKFKIVDIGNVKLRLQGNDRSSVNRILDTAVRYARVLFSRIIYETLEPLGKEAIERGAAKGFRILNELTR
ncbi:unnamed protein product [Darwinula stevensoni]|uniref:Uncharacterized protein n=1 Tax=Darwinula stevensoni TaxID=69355 RepID=A0A7R8X1G1_9CRUS|nr:unnamed protein product [Darwinula stevensoni]CAG0882229.1 unnamed protein product [Darwinula stevensoni]